jgi:hypothetical protein
VLTVLLPPEEDHRFPSASELNGVGYRDVARISGSLPGKVRGPDQLDRYRSRFRPIDPRVDSLHSRCTGHF